jgi:hypothetical protein
VYSIEVAFERAPVRFRDERTFAVASLEFGRIDAGVDAPALETVEAFREAL